MQYFGYENWRAHGHILKVHRTDCPFCRGGQGQAGGTRADNGKWIPLGEFTDQNLAIAAAKERTAAREVRGCKFCCA